jgi:hypothetical protein
MDIQTLRLVVREDEINQFLPRVLAADAAVENLRLRVTPEGLVVLGDYPTMMFKMSFETLWEVSAAEGQVQARLASIKVAGLPATLLRGVLLKVIRDATGHQPGIRVVDESVFVDVAQLLQARKVPVSLHLTGLSCGTGQVVLEAGPPPAAKA